MRKREKVEKNAHVQAWMERGWYDRAQTLDLEPCKCMCAIECARKYACEGVLFTNTMW